MDANYIYLYYSRYEYSSIPGWHYKFYTRKIQKSDYTTVSTSWESHNNTWYVPTTTTADSKVHSAYKWFGWLGENIEGYERSGYGGYSLESGLVHEYYNNGTVDFENIDIDSYGDKNYSNIVTCPHQSGHKKSIIFVIKKEETYGTEAEKTLYRGV